MSVPHRDPYRVVFSRDLAVPAPRSGVVSGVRLIYKGVPYIMAGKMLERMQETDPDAAFEKLPCRAMTPDSKRMMVFFPGGIGDVVSLRPVLQQFRFEHPGVELAVACTMADQCLLGDVATLWDYPLTETVADHYDAWVNIAEMDRASVGQELPVTFAEYLGVAVPMLGPTLTANEQYREGLRGYLPRNGRLRIGIQMDSACHFRSIPHSLGALTMMALIERGCECFMLGGPENQVVFKNEDGSDALPDHIHDMIRPLGPLEHYVAFISLMDGILTADTAALHIGGALGIPTVAVFGLTDGAKRTGFYPSVTYIQGQAECSPCERILHDPPCDQKHCIAIAGLHPEMLADRVLEAIREQHDGQV